MRDALQWYLLSPHFQLGVQLAGGIILTSLPVFVRWVGGGREQGEGGIQVLGWSASSIWYRNAACGT